MNPRDAFCPTLDCPARGRCGEANIHIHARTPPRSRCTVCGKTFGARAGTVFPRRATDAATITRVVTLVAYGCPVAAIVVACGVQRQTVAAGVDAAGSQCPAVHRHRVCQPHDLGAVQADELRVPQQGGGGWLAMARVVSTRLWLGDTVSLSRDAALLNRLCALVRACALPAPLRVCVDGCAACVGCIQRMARSPLPRNGRRGRCALPERAGRVIGQVVKQREAEQVVGVTRRLAHGTAAWAARWHDPHGVHRATEWYVSRTPSPADTAHTRGGTHGAAVGGGGCPRILAVACAGG